MKIKAYIRTLKTINAEYIRIKLFLAKELQEASITVNASTGKVEAHSENIGKGNFDVIDDYVLEFLNKEFEVLATHSLSGYLLSMLGMYNPDDKSFTLTIKKDMTIANWNSNEIEKQLNLYG